MAYVKTGLPTGRPKGGFNEDRVLRSSLGAVREMHRIAGNIGYETLARKAGVSDMTLRKWFRGDSAPTWGAFDAVVEALGYEVKLVKKEAPHDAA